MRGHDWHLDDDGVVVTVVADQHRETELLVPDGDRDAHRVDRAAQRALATRRTWLSVVTRDPARTGDRLAEHGLPVQAPPETLMSVALSDQPRRGLPDGYAAETTGLQVTVRAPDGTEAAAGQAGLVEGHLVPDRIVTEPAHRRRGLGGAVMTALVDGGLAAGATHGVLVASPEGRLLYEALGWERVADVLIAQQP